MNIKYDFSSRVVVVTGAARGVGRSIVHAFADAGASVVAADRDSDGLALTRETSSTKVETVVADITSPEDVTRTVQTVVERFGRLDICVNDAAVAPHIGLLEQSPAVWDTVYAVNCRGTFLMCQAAGRQMIHQGDGGRIINFSSGVSSRGSAGAAAYASSRAATESLTRVVAIELAPYEILVNCVSPGLIDTQPKPLPPSMAASLQERIPALPLARAGRPEEVANLVLWLGSDAASYVTGAVYHVDGGAGVGGRASTSPVVDEDVRYDWVTGAQR